MMLDRRQLLWTLASTLSALGLRLEASPGELASPREPGGRLGSKLIPPDRIGCLYNGYILTVNPVQALDGRSADDRHRLVVLHALLVDPRSGRVAAVYPSFEGDPTAGEVVAHPVTDYPQLLATEQPTPPGISAAQLFVYWRNQGIDEELLSDLWLVDLQGAVVTPGLIDDHFHVSSWSKKLPDEGKRFGYYADVGDPRYYTEGGTWERFCVRKSLWRIVADANAHLAEEGKETIYLHGFWSAMIDDQSDDGSPSTFLFTSSEAGGDGTYNPDFLLNRVGTGATAPTVPPADPCASDSSSWPPLDYETAAAVLIHTSGQFCWYNSAVLEAFNRQQREELGARFATAALAEVVVGSDGEPWTLSLADESADHEDLFSIALPFAVDVVVDPGGSEAALHVPFYVSEIDPDLGRLLGQPMLPTVADHAFAASAASLDLVPFFRPIVESITAADWDEAAQYWGEPRSNERLAYGYWNPHKPYATNWYTGAERGLLQYVFDQQAGLWRPSGYGEHYVMRDALSAVVLDPLTVEEGMRQRRNLARWCHRHGITSVQDIMFYRRSYNPQEFDACRGLSFNHLYSGGERFFDEVGLDRSVPTGQLNLRIGLYYYIENAFGIDEVLGLAHDPTGGYDAERLLPPEDHPEHPGWVRWVGWKLQLDGGTGARTLFSNAPMAKAAIDDPYQTLEQGGASLTFLNHGFGLLTMTNLQEQVFTSRESAALYWLVRESDRSSSFSNSALVGDWTFLKNGVAGWLGRELDVETLAADLATLEHVTLTRSEDPGLDQPAELAAKIESLLAQVASGWERTLTALVKIWYEKSVRSAGPFPIPSQVVCHNIGDGAVDLYVRAIAQLRSDLETLPQRWEDLPDYWQTAIPPDADLAAIDRVFEGERYRVEHLLNISAGLLDQILGEDGLDADTEIRARNVVLSTQPALLVLDGQAMRTYGFPYPQELWEIPSGGDSALWRGVPASPRYHHQMPCPVYIDHGIPFTLNTDPPAVRDPRPAITLIGAVGRTPVEIDPEHWLDQNGDEPTERPADYLVGKAYAPLGLTPSTPDNPMHLTVEQALCAMTFWAAYVAGLDQEQGALAPPSAGGGGGGGWFADLVVWKTNPLAIQGPDGMTLESVATIPEGSEDATRVAMLNAFIKKLRPAMTVVGGVPVFLGSSA